MVVVGEFCQGEECEPVILAFSNEDPQVLLQFLIDSFCLSISLRVVGSGHCGFDPKQSVQLLHKGSDKLRSMIGHNLLREAMELPDVLEVEVGCSCSCDGGECFGEVGSLAYGVDCHHDSVISTQFWELGDEVHADGVPVLLRNWEWLKFPNG